MTTAVYPGTFDPFTAGHFDVASRSRRLADHLTILVAVLRLELPLAAMNQDLGFPTLLVPARAELAGTSSTLARLAT